MNIFRALFPDAATLKDKEVRIEYLEVEIEGLHSKNANLWQSYNSAVADTAKAVGERDEFKAKLREQVDADLLLVSARITQAIIAGKKPSPHEISEQQRLLSQQQALSPVQYYASSPYQQQMGVLGQIGLGGILSSYP